MKFNKGDCIRYTKGRLNDEIGERLDALLSLDKNKE